MNKFNRYKDLTPEETVKRNRAALEDIGIEIEEDFVHSTKDIWTGGISFPSIEFGTNGKGTSELFCKASAYGEALERIQNGLSSVEWFKASNSTKSFGDFEFFVDETLGESKHIFEKFPFFLEPCLTDFNLMELRNPSNEKELLAFLKEELSPLTKYVPFYNYCTRKVENLPINLIEYLGGTNGLCSGNTPHEALVQGLSEVCERFVEPIIYKNRLTPPEVPRDFLKENYKYLFNILKELEEQSNSSLRVYDCSLHKHFPVVCVCMIEKETQTYRLQYGAHPLFSISLERCLTELTQGYNLHCYEDVRSCTTPLEVKDPWVGENMENRFIKGNGYCNIEFFYSKPSYEWDISNWIDPRDFSNKKGFDFLIKALSQVSNNIFIRDNSFLEVPAYTIFIPGVTTFPFALGWKGFDNEEKASYVEKLPLLKKGFLNDNFEDSWKSVVRALIDFLESSNRPPLKDIPISKTYFSSYEDLSILKACLYREIGDTPSLISTLESLKSKNSFIRGIIIEESLLEKNIPEEERLAIIEKFLGKKERDFIEKRWQDKNTYLEHLYYDCTLDSKELFKYEEGEKDLPSLKYDEVLLALKKKQIENGPIPQERLGEIL